MEYVIKNFVRYITKKSSRTDAEVSTEGNGGR